jgi:type I restriction enzyme S subunit
VSSSGISGSHAEAKVRGPGVVTGRCGTLGQVFYITGDYWPLNTSLYVRDFKSNNPRFVAVLLESMDLAQHEGAAAVPGLNRNQLHTVPVRVPDRAAQDRIAAIIESIDDLIENNRRRVEVLEEMARAIYREWFVHFRYPGHENVPLVDSSFGQIPDGWRWAPFSELATFVNGFAFKPAHWGTVGRPIIKIKELKQGVTNDTPRCAEESVDQKYRIEPGDLLFSWSADLGVYRWFGEPGLLNQHLFAVTARGNLSTDFLQHALSGAMTQFWDRAQGTTMRHIKRSALTEVSAVVPPAWLVDRLTEAVAPLVRQTLIVQRLERNLVGLRDLLLPKLVTGQIDVSHLDLDGLAEAATA